MASAPTTDGLATACAEAEADGEAAWAATTLAAAAADDDSGGAVAAPELPHAAIIVAMNAMNAMKGERSSG